MFIWVMASYRNSPVLYYVPGIWSLIVYLIQLVIAVIIFNCVRQTGTAEFLGFRQIVAPATSSRQLVTSGCYGIVRHPLYLFTILFMILNPVMTAQWLLLTLLSTIYFIVGAVVEERRMVAKFGDEYLRYQKTVPFLIPRGKRSDSRLKP